nr:replication termination factor 2 isoform X2 [Bactrocera oleae]
MGCDGGTIPRRDELKDKDAEREFRWLHCALTQEHLQEPIVMCGFGRLYSKQSIIEQLLEKEKKPESIKHIRTLKDIKTLKLTSNPSYTTEDKTEGLLDTRHAPYICKLIGLEMSGKFRFVALWSCGCVISERALKQIKRNDSGGSTCPLCLEPFSVEDVVVLNGSEEDLELMQAKMEIRNIKRKSSKKDKKGQDGVRNVGKLSIQKTFTEEKKQDFEKGEKCKKTEDQNDNTPSTSQSSTIGPNKLISNLKRSVVSENVLEDPELKRLRNNYSVAKDPKASDVYKSLFTTHKSEKEQSRAHWVTYNPFYN